MLHKPLNYLICGMLLLGGAVTTLLADDLNPPGARGTPKSTYQHWQFPTSATNNVPPDPDVDNAYGNPTMDLEGSGIWLGNGWGNRTGIWRLTKPYGKLVFDIPNCNDPTGIKKVYVQVVYTGEIAVSGKNAGGGDLDVRALAEEALDDGWSYQRFILTDWDNCPVSETITIEPLTGVLEVDQVVIDTWCVNMIFENITEFNEYDNGFNGADLSVLNTSIGGNILGHGCQESANNRLADDFFYPGSDPFWPGVLHLLAYQTNSDLESTITSVNVRLWDGQPGQFGSNLIYETTRPPIGTFADAYRVVDYDRLGSNRPLMRLAVDISDMPSLTQGEYWLDWQMAGTSSLSGPWCPPLVCADFPGSGNAIQYIGSTGIWQPVQDSGGNWPNDLYFGIEGSINGSSGSLLLGVTNLKAGEQAVINLSGGTSGTKAVTVYGTKAGRTFVNNIAGYCATFGIKGVKQSKVIGGLNRTFDANGEITFGINIPNSAAGLRVFFQSAEHGTCPDEIMSNLVEAVVQ